MKSQEPGDQDNMTALENARREKEIVDQKILQSIEKQREIRKNYLEEIRKVEEQDVSVMNFKIERDSHTWQLASTSAKMLLLLFRTNVRSVLPRAETILEFAIIFALLLLLNKQKIYLSSISVGLEFTLRQVVSHNLNKNEILNIKNRLVDTCKNMQVKA